MYPVAAFGAMARQLLLSRPTDADTRLDALVKTTTGDVSASKRVCGHCQVNSGW
jgi:hypothetical protein